MLKVVILSHMTLTRMRSFTAGASVGSTQIDIGFKQIIAGRLERIRGYLPLPPERLAERMTHGRFGEFKCSFGGGGTLEMPVLPIRVPGLQEGFNDPQLGIEDSKMMLSRFVWNSPSTTPASDSDNPTGKIYEACLIDK